MMALDGDPLWDKALEGGEATDLALAVLGTDLEEEEAVLPGSSSNPVDSFLLVLGNVIHCIHPIVLSDASVGGENILTGFLINH